MLPIYWHYHVNWTSITKDFVWSAKAFCFMSVKIAISHVTQGYYVALWCTITTPPPHLYGIAVFERGSRILLLSVCASDFIFSYMFGYLFLFVIYCIKGKTLLQTTNVHKFCSFWENLRKFSSYKFTKYSK